VDRILILRAPILSLQMRRASMRDESDADDFGSISVCSTNKEVLEEQPPHKTTGISASDADSRQCSLRFE
jgi:hypothetical protein